MNKRKMTVGFLGMGNIGAPTYRLLCDRFGDRFDVKYALVQNLNKDRGDIPRAILTDDPDLILNDPDVDIIVEFMGGISPAWEYLNKALQNGKSVVTANKAALAAKWSELSASAEKSGAGLYFEAACCAGIPLIRPLKSSLQANRITRLLGIINGTTNYILCKMQSDGLPYTQALALAQEKGLAEPDPTADVSGFDAANKLSILLSLAMHTRVSPDDVFMEGITRITMEDIKRGREMGLTLKLLAIGKQTGDKIEARVHPTFIPDDHPMASVHGSYNAAFITADAAGDLMFYGKGAGQLPTASALVSDIINAADTPKGLHDSFREEVTVQNHLTINEDWSSEYFLRINLTDKPGMLARVAEIMGACGISLARIIQTEFGGTFASVVFLTHTALESRIQKSIAMLKSALGNECSLECLIRVERDI